MFVAIANTPRDYVWGSTEAISELFGSTPTGAPQAELWLGAHPGSPSRIVGASEGVAGGAPDLAAWISTDPIAALGKRDRLPFLMKVLAAAAPLSLQAHPSAEQADEGFARENALGIPLDAPHRNYRDQFSKPEVIYALSDTFDALCGFRPIAEAREELLAFGLDELVPRLESLPKLLMWLLSGAPEIDEFVARAVSHAKSTGHQLVSLLAHYYPGDAGIVAALLLNRVTMTRGQALYLAPGNIHAYLSGVGIEIMTASDNVLRGGLTPKHVDVPELFRVLDFTPCEPPWLLPDIGSETFEIFRPKNDDFVLAHATGEGLMTLTGPAIALCTSGDIVVTGAITSQSLVRGDALYMTADEQYLSFSGAGEVFVGTTP